MNELPTLYIEPQAWIEGVRDVYTGRLTRSDAQVGDGHACAFGRVEGEALRMKHPQKYEQLLFSGPQTRALPPAEPSSHG